jgi:hypothetical protein
MKIKLDPWQQQVLEHEGDLGLCTGRRVGKTYILSRKAIDHMVKHSKPIIVVSLTEDQAMIIIAMALNYAREEYKTLIGKGKHKPTLKTLTLMINKKPIKMISRPVGNTGDATRGFEGGVLIVDEASRMPELFWIAAKPILLTMAGEIWMCSTPHGKQGYFWKSFERAVIKKDPDARFKFFYKNTEDVINERPISESWTEKQREGALRILAEDREEMTANQYGQEYQGRFMEDMQQLFSDDLILKCQNLERRPVMQRGDYFLGVDVARLGRDESTFEIIDRTDRKNLKHVENIITEQTLTTETTTKIFQLEESYCFKQIFIDAYGVGTGVFDQLITDDRTKRKTIAINHWSRPLDREEKKKAKVTVADIYLNLKMLMERGMIQLLKGDKIFASLKSIQYEYSDDGKMIITGSYKHIADGLTRGAWCSQDKSLNIWIA